MANDDLSTTGARLAHALEASGLSQRAASKAAGLSPAFLGAFFSRWRRRSAGTLDALSAERLAAVLGVKAAWLLYAEGKGPKPKGRKRGKGDHAADNVTA